MSATAAGPPLPATPLPQARRTLVGAGLAHALHDGYTDMIYVLLPVWQAEFGLGYGALAALRGLYAGAGSATQHPLASAAVSRAYGAAARGPLGTYNFTGDLGKAALPAFAALL